MSPAAGTPEQQIEAWKLQSRDYEDALMEVADMLGCSPDVYEPKEAVRLARELMTALEDVSRRSELEATPTFIRIGPFLLQVSGVWIRNGGADQEDDYCANRGK